MNAATKLTNKIQSLISSSTIKAHARCTGVDVTALQGQAVTVEVLGNLLVIRCNDEAVTIELTKHWKSGTYFAHWIRLNKALIALAATITPEVEAQEDGYSWWFDYENEWIFYDILGLERSDTFPFSQRDVRKSFRRLAHKVHPDHGGSNELMEQLIWAKDTILEMMEE